MSAYTALARRWRPRRFEEMIGQEHVLRALANALTSGRVHHAFLFAGTRGVGKTSVARILAKCLNCEQGVTATPCDQCASCREIDQGRSVDLLEVDAASRTRVDDTRDLLDNVQYAPTRSRFKIYLIDEVHMLSAHSFNALLKTLEEPPPHVKFLLATTDPQKLPVTVLSRCLQFNLKRLPAALIGARLSHILQSEQIEFEPAAVQLLAQAGDGSLRDALSLLDQLIAYGRGRALEADAREMLGTVQRDQVLRLAEGLADRQAATLLAEAAKLEELGVDYAQLLDQLAALLERVALKQLWPAFEGDELHPPELLERLAGQLAPEDVQLFYQTAILGRRDLPLAPDARTGFRMTLIRMLAFRPPGSPASAPVLAPTPATTSRPGTLPGVQASTAGAAPGTDEWTGLIGQLELQGAPKQLAAQCVWLGRDAETVRLALDPRGVSLRTPAVEEKLARALSSHFGQTLRLRIEVGELPSQTPALAQQIAAAERLQQARAAFEADATVAAVKSRFAAMVLPESVRPAKPPDAG